MTLKLLGKKKGMTAVFDEKGNVIPCTVIQAEPNIVVRKIKGEHFQSVQLAAVKVADSKKKNVKKPLVGHFAAAKVEPRRHLFESKVDALDEYEIGQEVGLDYFSEGQLIDVIGTSKGKGFQGVVKRYGFRGGPASHGSGFHRTAGSTGMRSTPGRCFKGKKMAGRMGGERKTVENLKVIQIDLERQILLVKGAIPGSRDGIVYIRKSVKKSNMVN